MTEIPSVFLLLGTSHADRISTHDTVGIDSTMTLFICLSRSQYYGLTVILLGDSMLNEQECFTYFGVFKLSYLCRRDKLSSSLLHYEASESGWHSVSMWLWIGYVYLCHILTHVHTSGSDGSVLQILTVWGQPGIDPNQTESPEFAAIGGLSLKNVFKLTNSCILNVFSYLRYKCLLIWLITSCSVVFVVTQTFVLLLFVHVYNCVLIIETSVPGCSTLTIKMITNTQIVIS